MTNRKRVLAWLGSCHPPGQEMASSLAALLDAVADEARREERKLCQRDVELLEGERDVDYGDPFNAGYLAALHEVARRIRSRGEGGT